MALHNARSDPAIRVATCGLTTLDLIQYVDRLPGPDEKIQAQSARLEFGGPAANAAFAVRALGAQARVVTVLGDASIGRALAGELAEAGIDVVDAGADRTWQPPVSAVAVTGSHRSVVSVNAGSEPEVRWPVGTLNGCQALLLDGHHLGLCLAAAREARSLGVPVLLDGGSWKSGLDHLIPLLDAAVISTDFRAPGAPADPVEGWSVPVAVTSGDGPIRYRSSGSGGTLDVPAVDVADTLGAGDVFHGAWLTFVAEHGLDPFADGLRYAARVASFSCRFPGAHEWARHIDP